MRTLPFREDSLKSGRIFPDDIETDPSIIFHGTTTSKAEIIESDGFITTASIDRDSIRHVCTIFENMKWLGHQMGGYGVLKTFSEADFTENKNTILFFALESARASLYATRDFAGGEKLRAVRLALEDLDSYLSEVAVRNAHQEQLNRNLQSLKRLNAHPKQFEKFIYRSIDLSDLRQQLNKLDPLKQLARGAYVYCGPVLRHPADLIQAANFTAAVAF